MQTSSPFFACAQTVLIAFVCLATAPAAADIELPGGDSFLDGSFQGMTYGSSGVANLAPRLYIGEFASTVPPFDQIIGTGLEFSYDAPVFGESTVTTTYRLTNNDAGGPFNDLRFFLDLKAKGQPLGLDTGMALGFGLPTLPGYPDQFQIFDFDAPGDLPLQRIETSGALNGSTADACNTGCYTDLALQWNKAQLLVGETWEIPVTLTDDSTQIASGRYLMASPLGMQSSEIAFGAIQLVPEPQTYVMLLAGLGMVGFMLKWRKR